MDDLISRSTLLQRFNDSRIQITFDLPVEEILGEDVDIDDFTMLVQDAIQAYKKMVIGTIKDMPTVAGTVIGSGEYPYYNGLKEGKQLGYNKAIYEFAEKFIYKAVCEGCSGCCDCYENEYQMTCEDWKYYMGMAEQMKAGVKNE